MRKEIFLNEKFYHIYNRGVDKRKIFLDKKDYLRFVKSMYLFNDSEIHDYDLTQIDIRSLASYKKKPTVNILHWCLMSNHFHIFIQQKQNGGISNFMHKLGTGYTKYFNQKYERTGRLFQGSFKAKLIDKDTYFSHLGAYISLNPLEIYHPEWKERGIPKQNLTTIKNNLLNYPWSSFREYFGLNPVPQLTTKKIFMDFFNGNINEFELVINDFILNGLPKTTKLSFVV